MTVRVVCLLRACAWQGDFPTAEEAERARLAHVGSQRHQRANREALGILEEK
jgi:hypothetical protein